MWLKVSGIILRNKILLLSVLLAITAFFGYHAQNVEMSYEYASLLPKKDQAFKDYHKFVDVFGEEGNLIIIGVQDPDFFKIDRFKRWRQLARELEKIEGVEDLLTVSNTYNLVKNTEKKKFEVKPVFPDTIETQKELD
ncbi:MAG: RND family transporter, partial [Prolixibacteraceae bacterium]